MDGLGRTPHMNPFELLLYQVPTVAGIVLLQATEAPNWATLGIGGVLAGIMFWFYRQDRERSEKRLGDVASDYKSTIQENTKAITRLNEKLDRHEESEDA